MSELAAVLEKRRRKSEVKGAIVENVPGVTIADAIHTTNNDKKQVVDNDDDNGNEYDDNNNSGAGNELQKILRRRRRKSETASSVIVKEGKISDADAIHTHHEYNKSDSTEANINMVEAHLRSLETKAEKGRKDLLKVETEISKNERRLSQMSINNDDYEEENDNTTGETLETSSSIEVGKDENIAPSPTALESNATAKVDNEEILESPTLTTTSNDKTANDNEATEDDNRPSIEENQKEDATDNKEEQSELDTHDDGNNDNNNDDNNKEEEEQVEEEEEQVEEEGQPKEDPHLGKIEAKPGFWVTDNELAQLRIFLPGFKKVANERLYKVLPNLMAKTSKNVNTKKSNLDNRPRWKN